MSRAGVSFPGFFRPLSEEFRIGRFSEVPKIVEDFRMFRSSANEFKYNLSDKLDISLISSLVRIWKIRHSSPGCRLV